MAWADFSQSELINSGTYIVKTVYDGDTIGVEIDGITERVRIIGIDTPETGGNNTDIECYGKEATNFGKKMLEGQRVRLVADPLSDNRDRYDRLLRYIEIYQTKQDYGLLIIQNGLSPMYNIFPHSKSDEYAAAAKTAQNNNVGLWAVCQTYST